jgi:hypothetical protein
LRIGVYTGFCINGLKQFICSFLSHLFSLQFSLA